MTKDKKKKKGKQEELSESWKTFSKEMTQRISDMTTKAGEDLEDHYQMWNEYSNKMSELMSRFDPEDEKVFDEVKDLWRDYSEKLGGKFVEVLEREAGPSREVYKMWTEYSEKMGNQFTELVSESMKEQQDLYEIWMDSFGVKDNGNEGNIPDVYKDVNRFWQDVWARSKNIMPPTNAGELDPSANLKELSELWANAYSKMAKNMINSPDFAKMDGNILNANLEALKANNHMMNQTLGAMGLPTKDNLQDIYKKLHDMDRKLSEMARTLNAMKK